MNLPGPGKFMQAYRKDTKNRAGVCSAIIFILTHRFARLSIVALPKNQDPAPGRRQQDDRLSWYFSL